MNVTLDRVQRRILAKAVMYFREITIAGNSLTTGRVNASVESPIPQFFCGLLNGSDTKWQRR